MTVASSPGVGTSGRRVVTVALAANVAVAAAKLVGFIVTGSGALLAETLHSVADTGNQGLLMLGSHRASERPSATHPFGRGREHYFWAFIVGLLLFGVGGVTAVIEGLDRILRGAQPLVSPRVALAMIAVGLVAETVSLRSALRHARDTRPSDETLRVHLRTSRDPDDTIVVVEDVGALAGLSIALLGIGMAAITGSPTWDSVATLLIGLLLCGLAAFLTVQMHALLVGEPARPTDLAAIRQAVVGTDGVGRILNLRTEHLGPEDLLVCVKVALADVTTVDRALAVIDDVDRRVAAAVPHTLVTYVELDRYDPDRAGGPWT